MGTSWYASKGSGGVCVFPEPEFVFVWTVVREWGDIGPVVEWEVVERPRETVDSVVAVGFLLGTLLAPAATPAPTGPL